jgi:acetyltransferase-like isoleucine patch superfamily enzyme
VKKFRTALAFLLPVLPTRLRLGLGRLVLGWEIHPTAFVGRSVVIADEVVLGPGAWIGHANMIKGLSELRLEDDAIIGTLNWISGPPTGSGAFPWSPRRHPALLLARGATVTTRHIVDCSDTVTLDELAALAGIRSTVFTHSIDLVRNQQRTGRVTLGERAAVLSNSVVLPGTAVPARSIVSAGSVVNTVLVTEGVLYRGNPAVEVRDLPDSLAFLNRTSSTTA